MEYLPPYCGNKWNSGNLRNHLCGNPSQCFCDCHQPAMLTNRKLKKQIDFHETRAKELKKVLEARPVERPQDI